MKRLSGCAMIWVLALLPALSQQYYYRDVTKSNLPGGLDVHSMDAEFFDADEDGDLDIVVAVEGGANILLLNDGQGRFTHSHALTARVEDSEDIGIADFNGDGHMDIVFVAEDTPGNELYFGDGKGYFTPANDNIPLHHRTNAVFVYDVNGDGAPDLILGSSKAKDSPGYNAFLINDGKGRFTDETKKRMPPVYDDTQDLAMGDVNGDGLPDLLVANEDDNRMYFNNGDGTFSDASARLPVQQGVREVTREVCLKDMDGDGDLDIAWFNTAGDRQNRLYINDGHGNFSDVTADRLPEETLRTWDGGLYDVNNDGFPDIITCNSTPAVKAELYGVWLNDGRGYFTNATTTIFPPSVRGSGWDVEAADLNGDGWLDLYLCSRANNDSAMSRDILLFGVPGKATKTGRRQPVSSDALQTPVLSPRPYHIHRSSLTNVYRKMQKGRQVKIAFLGGSITAMRGWRYMVEQYLVKRFPETEFDFVQAGIPSMGSTSDAFRMERDVVNFGPVDLLFVEAAVNDHVKGRRPVEQIRGMEGVVRHARYVGPQTDIVFMYFVDPDKMKDYRAGRVPEVIVNHERVAKHYGISSINLAREVTDRIDAGEFDWEHDFRNLHPSPFGQKIYRNSIVMFLEDEWKKAEKEKGTVSDHTLPEKLDPGCYDRGWLCPAWQLPQAKGWRYVEVWDPEYPVGKRTNYYHVPVLIGETPGKVLKYAFEGNAVGIVAIAGPDEGVIEYRIDKSAWKKQDLFTKYSRGLYLPWYYTLGAGLAPGEHTLEIRLSGEKNDQSKGTKCHIRYLFVNR